VSRENPTAWKPLWSTKQTRARQKFAKDGMFHSVITAPTTRSSVGRLRSAVPAEGRLGGGCRCSQSLVDRRSSHPCVKTCYQSKSDKTVARARHDRRDEATLLRAPGLRTPEWRSSVGKQQDIELSVCDEIVCKLHIVRALSCGAVDRFDDRLVDRAR
jgi:uncharacterized membrane protein